MTHWLIGASLLFPSVGLHRISTSLVFLIIFILITIYCKLFNAREIKFYAAYLLIILLNSLLTTIFAGGFFSPRDIAFYAIFGLFVTYGFYIARNGVSRNSFFDGYISASRFVAIFSVLQFLFWNYFNYSPFWLAGIHNVNLHTEAAHQYSNSLTAYGRAFAFSFEPSANALLLSVAFFRSLKRRKFIDVFIFTSGLFSTQSLTAYVCIIFVFSFYYIARLSFKNIIFSMFFLFSAWGLIDIFGVRILNFASNFEDSSVAYRILNIILGLDGSFLSRSNSISNSFDLIIESPFFGWGINSQYLTDYLVYNSLDIEENKGINSMILLLTTQFGIPCIFYLLMKVIIGLIRSANLGFRYSYYPEISAIVLVAMVSFSLFHTYAIWVFLGMILYSSKQPILE